MIIEHKKSNPPYVDEFWNDAIKQKQMKEPKKGMKLLISHPV
jgi:hypothetical protein